jgi:error-prone DNA polymerase
VVFMTLEDETGFANVIVWPSVFERHSLLARTCAFLGVSGIIQAAEGVVHVVAHSLWEPRTRIRPTETASRDFH